MEVQSVPLNGLLCILEKRQFPQFMAFTAIRAAQNARRERQRLIEKANSLVAVKLNDRQCVRLLDLLRESNNTIFLTNLIEGMNISIVLRLLFMLC